MISRYIFRLIQLANTRREKVVARKLAVLCRPLVEQVDGQAEVAQLLIQYSLLCLDDTTEEERQQSALLIKNRLNMSSVRRLAKREWRAWRRKLTDSASLLTDHQYRAIKQLLSEMEVAPRLVKKRPTVRQSINLSLPLAQRVLDHWRVGRVEKLERWRGCYRAHTKQGVWLIMVWTKDEVVGAGPERALKRAWLDRLLARLERAHYVVSALSIETDPLITHVHVRGYYFSVYGCILAAAITGGPLFDQFGGRPVKRS